MKMPLYIAFYLGLHCLQSIPLGVPSLQRVIMFEIFYSTTQLYSTSIDSM